MANLVAHVLLFKCPKCRRPIPLVMSTASPLDGGYSLEEAKGRTWELACLERSHCGWAGSQVGAESKEAFTVPWPY